MLKISILIILCFIISLPAMADPFSDVPQGHWAYDAVQMLEEKGLVEGYPDGLFKGERPMTRYEMAMVVARVIAKLEQLQSSIPEMPDLSIYATKTDLEAINKLIGEYGNELDALGVRVTNVEDTLGKLSGRVEELERIKLSGTFESVGLSTGISPEDGNISGPGTPDTDSHIVRPGYDRYMYPISEPFKLGDASALVSRLDLTITAKIADKIKGGANIIAYSGFGDKNLIECWGLMVPYNTTGVSSIWTQNFQANMGTLWVDSDVENWDFTIKIGEYNLNKVSKNLFYAQRSTIGMGGKDVYPLEGINITGKLYKKID
ncbi:MAG: S-layer homology domain-containing protein, partial [Candidatus Eremiobacterota bacterium]